MEQPEKKKEWVTPELLVLVRSHPEEAVLATCKSGSIAGSGADACDPFGFCDQIADS